MTTLESFSGLTILGDMDGTQFDWCSRFEAVLLNLDSSFPIVPEGSRVGFDYFWIKEANPDTIIAALNHPDLYDDLDPLPGAIEAVREMLDAGANFISCSTPTWTNPGCVPGKLASITKHFGAEETKNLILTHDKTTIRGDILWDDKPEITGAMTPNWIQVMAHQDYNSHIDTPLRLTDPLQWRSVFSARCGINLRAAHQLV